MSSFNSALNSSVTLFGLDIYKEHINKDASDETVIKYGKQFGLLLAFLAMFIAPFIANAPDGLFGYLQEINGCYSIPILTIIVVGYLTKRVPAIAAKVAIILGAVLYAISQFILKPYVFGDESYPNFLHVMAILFVMNIIIMLIIGQLKPRTTDFELAYSEEVDITPYKYVKQVSLVILIIVVSSYVYFS